MTFRYITLVIIISLFSSCSSEYSKNRNFIVPDGSYKIASYPDKYQILATVDRIDSTDIVTLIARDQGQGSPWSVRHIEGKEYKINVLGTNKYLTFADGTIILSEENDGESQLWFIHKYNDDKFKIISKSQIFCLCLPGDDAKKNIITTRKCNNKIEEYWLFESIADH